MDFQQLLAKMQELDKPAATVETAPVVTDECGEMPPAPMGIDKPDTPPPSMSINLNAQGLDNIEDLMALIKAVNPDMDKPALPTMGMEPSIASIKPALPPLKMLPDFDADNNDMPGGEMDLPPGHDQDHAMIKTLDKDRDGDHDMDDHGMEKKDKEEAFANSVGDSEPEVGDMDDVVRNGDDLHKKKQMFAKAQDGDNPMAVEGTDLRSQIRAELLRRLAEAKGAK